MRVREHLKKRRPSRIELCALKGTGIVDLRQAEWDSLVEFNSSRMSMIMPVSSKGDLACTKG